jgi:hypothetical protein
LISVVSKFTPYGEKAIAEAKKAGQLAEFAQNYPTPAERKMLLVDPSKVKNSDIWARYVFREAFGITSKKLGEEWKEFSLKEEGTEKRKPPANRDFLEASWKRYKEISKALPLKDDQIEECIKDLLILFSNKCMDQRTLQIGINNLFL